MVVQGGRFGVGCLAHVEGCSARRCVQAVGRRECDPGVVDGVTVPWCDN